MRTDGLYGALAALMITGATWSQAVNAQQIEAPDPQGNIVIPGVQDATPPPTGVEGTMEDPIFGDLELPDAANTDGPWPFTINIPVSLSNLHEHVWQVILFCNIRYNSGGEERLGWQGHAFVNFDETSRSFDDVVNVRLVSRNVAAPERATSYVCHLKLHNGSNHGSPGCFKGVFSWTTAEGDSDDCLRGNLLKTTLVAGEINPLEGTATKCRVDPYNNRSLIDCQ